MDSEHLRDQAFDLLGLPLFISDGWDLLPPEEKAWREKKIEELFNEAGRIDQQDGCWN